MKRVRARTPQRFRRLDRVVAALAYLAFFAATLVAGHRYFHCAYMNESSLDSCCPSAHEHFTNEDESAIEDGPCCETKRFAALSTAVTESARAPLRAPSAATVTTAPVAPSRMAALTSRAREARAGPPPPRPGEYRLRLMISLT